MKSKMIWSARFALSIELLTYSFGNKMSRLQLQFHCLAVFMGSVAKYL